jgi:hypothetical protein
MTYIFEAVIETDGGTYRAFQISSDAYCVTEDGVEGLADCITLEPAERALLAPENLVGTLTTWIYEMRRGLTILESALSRRR